MTHPTPLTDTEALRLKIEKLLALAASPNAHEAQLAMSRAQALIQKFNVDMDARLDNNESTVQTLEYMPERLSPALLKSLPYIVLTGCQLFGCWSLMRCNRDGCFKSFKLYGFPLNLKLATYTIDAILAQGHVDYRAAYAQYRSISFAEGFWRGFAMQLKERFAPHLQAQTGLIIYDKVRARADLDQTGHFEANSVNDYGRKAGIQAANSVSLHKPISFGNQGNQLTGGKA